MPADPPPGRHPDTTLVSAGPGETEAIGARLAAELAAGDVVLIEGEVGAGKTTLVRGAVRALGHEGPVTSPTFTLAARYDDGHVPVSHLDLYRLRDAGLDAEELALLDAELGPERLVFVEWPDAVAAADWLGERPVSRRVVLRHAGADRREVEVSGG